MTTTAVTPPINYWKCPNGAAHTWTYRGSASQKYRCASCGQVVSKSDLKANTDTDK